MYKYILLNFCTNIRRSPVISLILFMQILLTSYILFTTQFDQRQTELNNASVQNSYAKYRLYYLIPSANSGDDTMRSMGATFENSGETDYSDYEEFYEKVDSSENIRTAVQYLFGIYRTEPLPGIPFSEEKKGYYDYYHSGSAEGSYRLNAFGVDEDYFRYFNVVLDSGRLFTADEFQNLDPDEVPVIMGYSYKEHYSIGDTIKGNFLSVPGDFGETKISEMTFRVVGFIAEGQTFFYVGNPGAPYLFDRYILFPYIHKPLSEWMGMFDRLSGYTTLKKIAAYYLNGLGGTMMSLKYYFSEDEEHEKAMYDELVSILDETGLSRYYEAITPARTYVQFADRSAERSRMLRALLSVMMAFSFLSVIFAAVNNVSNSMKAYAIHGMTGATKGRLVFYSVIETLFYCVLGSVSGYAWFYYLCIVSGGYWGHPAFHYAVNTGTVSLAAFTVISCTFSALFIFIKLRNYCISSLIRGNEVRKGRTLPLYRILVFVMFAFSGVCITYASSYVWQSNHVDRYQRSFYSTNSYQVYVQSLPEENAPEPRLDYLNIGAERFVLDRLVSTFYDPVTGPAVRATYFKGGAETPDVLSGRYFTEEEVGKKSGYAVVGRNVLENFVEEKDGKQIFVFNDNEFEVIGVIGREGHETTLDDWAILTLPTVYGMYGAAGTYVVDSDTEEEVLNVISLIEEQSKGNSKITHIRNTGWVDIGFSNRILYIFIAQILITSFVFCVYYMDKIRYVITVKKFLGYSAGMIFADTAAHFVFVSLAAYAAGNGLMYIASETLLSDTLLFSAFRINLPVLAFSLGILIIISFILSILAILRAFGGSARDLKRG